MVNPKMGKRKSTPEIQQPAPQRPPTVLQRLSLSVSSGFSTLRSSLRFRRELRRSTSEPNFDHEPDDRVFAYSETIRISASTEPPCPYDPSSYSSFPPLERPACSSCGLPLPKALSSKRRKSMGRSDLQMQPCRACRMRDPNSHLVLAERQARNLRSAGSAVRFTTRSGSESSGDLAPRPVAPHIAATRIDNPPRVARMPKGPDFDNIPWKQPGYVGGRPPTRRGPMPVHEQEELDSETGFTFDSIRQRLSPTIASNPKLHHIHGLPHSKDYPYVHKHEYQQHLVAQQEGRDSPLDPLITEYAARPQPAVATATGRLTTSTGVEVQDFSQTVFYRRGVSPIPITRSSPKPQGEQDERKKGDEGEETLPPIEPPSPEDTIGGTRMELRGGSPHSNQDSIPRLRGGRGSGDRMLMFKICFLTCGSKSNRRSENREDDSTDDDLPPPRPRTVKPGYNEFRRVPLPRGLITARQREARELAARATTATQIASQNAPASSLGPDVESISAANPTPPSTPPRPLAPTAETAATHNERFVPYLRGGGDSNTLPPTLFWLAGGKRKPITVARWKKQKPKTRMGGFLGMAVYGLKAGTECRSDTLIGRSSASSCNSSVKDGTLLSEPIKEGSISSAKLTKNRFSEKSARSEGSATREAPADDEAAEITSVESESTLNDPAQFDTPGDEATTQDDPLAEIASVDERPDANEGENAARDAIDDRGDRGENTAAQEDNDRGS